MPQGETAPRYCPACRAELYPIARLRPRPALPALGKFLMLLAIVASSAIFIGGMAWYVVQRDRWIESHRLGEMKPHGGLGGIVTLIPALVPGLLLGWLAYRLPKSLRLRCPKCTWREQYRIGRDGFVISSRPGAAMPPRHRAAAEPDYDRLIDQIQEGPPPPPAGTDDQASDADVAAWIYAELARSRSPEEVAADLVATGWNPETAEHLAEIGRRQTRHLRR
jgi:hypothetical protein